MTELRIRVLGAVEAVGPGGNAVLTGTRRVILGALALRAGGVVSFDGLVDVVWGSVPPRTATKTLHSHVARIRQALAVVGAAPVVSTRDLGYVLDLPREHVDAHRFDRLVTEARATLARGEHRAAGDTLRTALGLWRGEPFAGVELGEWGRHELDRLRELWLSATEDRWDAEIAIGEAVAATVELPALVASHPLRERLTGLLMRALYRCGRHADALSVYERLRRRLADELGADPSAELSELHTAILCRDATLDAPAVPASPAVPVPAQLPAKVGHFTGRETELSTLDSLVDGGDLPIVVISGPAGMGKTATAVQWVATVAHRFRDGQLFLDLRGHDPDQAMTAEQALAQLLGGLGVPEDRIPAGAQARSALYRTMLHGKRCVVLLDNAGTVGQLLPLVPAAADILLVVTSRVSLAALGAHHAVRRVVLDRLDDDDSVTLLTRVLGADRVAREPAATARLAMSCAGMPLALRIASARLTGHAGRSIAEVAGDVARGRLDGFAVDGDTRTVRTVLTSAYRPLSDTAQRLFRLSATIPAPTVSGHLGAVLAGLDDHAARRAFDELSSAHLVAGTGERRYRFHDLIREFAVDRAVAEEAEPARVRDQLIDWYLFVADEANRLINPHRDAVKPTFVLPPPSLPFAADRHAATQLLEAERHGFLPIVRHAREHGRPDAAWQLVYLLTSFYEMSGHWTERVELCQAGVAAARDAGSHDGEAEMLRALGVSFYMTRRLNEAVDTALTALDLVRRIGDLAGEGHVLNNLANAYSDLRRFDAATAAFEQAIVTSTAAGNRLGVALSQRNLGHALVRMGRAAESLHPLRTALAVFDEIGNARLRAGTLNTLGEAHRDLGRYQQAVADMTEALAISRDIGDRWLEWELLRDVGVTHLSAGDTDAALANFEQSLAVTRVVGDRNGEAIALCLIGRVHLETGGLIAAAGHLEQARVLRALVPDVYEEAHVHRALAELNRARGDGAAEVDHRDRAVRLYRQVNATAEAAQVSAEAGIPRS